MEVMLAGVVSFILLKKSKIKRGRETTREIQEKEGEESHPNCSLSFLAFVMSSNFYVFEYVIFFCGLLRFLAAAVIGGD